MPSPLRKTRKSKSPASKSPHSHGSKVRKKRERELAERAKHDSAVRDQLIELMEEDPELITTFQRHLERELGSKWNSLSSKQQASKIKNAMRQYRVPQSNLRGGKRTKRKLRKHGKSRKTRKSKKKKGGDDSMHRTFGKLVTDITGMHKNIYSNIRHKLRNIFIEMEKQNKDIDIEIVESNIKDLNELLDNNSDYTNNVSNCHPSIYNEIGNDGKSIYDLKMGIHPNIYKLPSRYVDKTKQELEDLLVKIANSDKNGCPSNYSYE
tara:strand:+ start:1414 stop:2208 length:795 start_codon:yes stop_codon:yes gene_type:complete